MTQPDSITTATPTDQAIVWIARLRAHDVSAADRSRFAEWLARDAAHRVAFDETMRFWQRLGNVAHLDEQQSTECNPLGAPLLLALTSRL